MKASIKLALATALVLGMTSSASALTITLKPTSTELVLFGNDSSQSDAAAAIAGEYPDLEVLYTGTRVAGTVVGVSSEDFAASYTTTFFNSDLDDSDARISYVGGSPINSEPVYAYIKDGNATPNWYLFDISGWNGTDTIEFEGFFWYDKNGTLLTTPKDVSHVSILGNHTNVPDGGTSLLLLGMAVSVIGLIRRRA